jgi:hypothetical protein
MGYSAKEVKNCGDLGCSHFLKRPFQNLSAAEELTCLDNPLDGVEELAEVA